MRLGIKGELFAEPYQKILNSWPKKACKDNIFSENCQSQYRSFNKLKLRTIYTEITLYNNLYF